MSVENRPVFKIGHITALSVFHILNLAEHEVLNEVSTQVNDADPLSQLVSVEEGFVEENWLDDLSNSNKLLRLQNREHEENTAVDAEVVTKSFVVPFAGGPHAVFDCLVDILEVFGANNEEYAVTAVDILDGVRIVERWRVLE